MSGSEQSSSIDTDGLWGDAQRSMVWRDKAARRAVYKALNLPIDDEMIINQQTGWGWRELGILLAAAIVIGAVWAAIVEPRKPPRAPPPIMAPTDAPTGMPSQSEAPPAPAALELHRRISIGP